MPTTEKIEIVEIKKTQKPSNYKPGEFYWDVDVVDGRTGRKVKQFDDTVGEGWARNWKLGDVVDVVWYKKQRVDRRSGATVEEWALKNPTAADKPKAPWQPRVAASATPSIVNAWMIAAQLMSFFYPGQKKKLSDVADLATAIMPYLDAAPVAAATAPIARPSVVAPVPEPAPVMQTPVVQPPVVDTYEEDDDKPF